MKHLKLFENFVLESVLSKTDIYDKYYKDIDSSIFNKIVEADPTSINDKVGKYSKWMINLFKSKNLKLEDLYKATEYLKAFDMFKHKLSIKDINAIKSLPELFKLVEPYLEKEEFTFTNDEERKLTGQFKEVYRNDKYRVIIPLTLKASKYFGRDTEWCTTNTDMFKKYTKGQNLDNLDEFCLFILYSEDLYERLQFHFDSSQFMDVYDSPIDMLEFIEENKDIVDFFQKHFDFLNFIELYEYDDKAATDILIFLKRFDHFHLLNYLKINKSRKYYDKIVDITKLNEVNWAILYNKKFLETYPNDCIANEGNLLMPIDIDIDYFLSYFEEFNFNTKNLVDYENQFPHKKEENADNSEYYDDYDDDIFSVCKYEGLVDFADLDIDIIKKMFEKLFKHLGVSNLEEMLDKYEWIREIFEKHGKVKNIEDFNREYKLFRILINEIDIFQNISEEILHLLREKHLEKIEFMNNKSYKTLLYKNNSPNCIDYIDGQFYVKTNFLFKLNVNMYLETISEIFMDYYGDEKLDCTEDIKNDIIKNKVNIENYTKEIIEIIENIKI